MTNTTPSQGVPLDQLKNLPLRLRSTHVGIDPAIDRLVEAVHPWWLFAHAQSRPRVVGLWGMTGTGKSSLVRSLVKELAVEDRTFWLDAGEHTRHNWLDDTLERIREQHDGAPFLLVVDEFQHARTVKDGSERTESPELRRLWEMMDSGRAIVRPVDQYGLRYLLDLHDQVRSMIEQGVVVRKGRVVRGVATYRRVMADHLRREKGAVNWALPVNCWDTVRDMEQVPLSISAFQERLEQLDQAGVLDLLKGILHSRMAPVPLDASKALVIVLGNLDELYTSGKEPWPELDPDVLRHRHRDLDTAGVHQALLELFRLEQVARLGTDHVVFPPMSAVTVNTLMHQQVEELVAVLGGGMGITIEVGEELIARIREKATIAVLGARPLVNAVQQVIPALFAQAVLQHGAGASDRCVLDVDNDKVIARLYAGSNCRVVPLRWPHGYGQVEPGNADHMRRVAVHEAGHLICGLWLTDHRPLQICARTAQHRTMGFVIWDRDPEACVTRAQVVPWLAMMLGGWAAENIAFGEDGVSAGCQDDLRKVASLSLGLVKEHGFGVDRLFRSEHASSSMPGFRTVLPQAEEQARLWVEEAEALALLTLKAEWNTVEVICSALCERGSLGPAQIDALVSREPHLVLRKFA